MISASLRILVNNIYKGTMPNTPNEQSISIQKKGSWRMCPQMKANGITATQAIIPKYTIHILRTGFT